MRRTDRLARADFSSLKVFFKESGKFFTLTVAKAHDEGAKFACVVSKKTAHRAHERNLIKRRCRAAIREVSLPSAYFIFTAKKSARTADFAEILADVRNVVVKASASLKEYAELQ